MRVGAHRPTKIAVVAEFPPMGTNHRTNDAGMQINPKRNAMQLKALNVFLERIVRMARYMNVEPAQDKDWQP